MRTRPQKITLGEMRSSGVRGLLIYCADYRCSHSIAISADRWPDDVRLSDLDARLACKACGKRGADVRPLFAVERPSSGYPAHGSGPRGRELNFNQPQGGCPATGAE
jgi:hypothetical protein